MSRYIDADRLKEELKNSGYCNNNWLDIEMYINNQPTADVRENVRGEWIDCGTHGDWAWEQDGHGNCWHIWKCSKCECTTEHCSNYCPNCGADMRGGHHEENN